MPLHGRRRFGVVTVFQSWFGKDWARRGPRSVTLGAAQWTQVLLPDPARVLFLLRMTVGGEFADENRGTGVTTGMFTHPAQAGSSNNSRVSFADYGDFVRGPIWIFPAAGTTALVTEFFVPDLVKRPSRTEMATNRLAKTVDDIILRCMNERKKMFARFQNGNSQPYIDAYPIGEPE